MPCRKNAGFTVVELMITLVVLGVLAAIALPSFQGVIRSNRVATTSNAVLASLALARSEAIKGVGPAGVCPSTDGTTCGNGTDWSGGWMVWRQDRNASGVVVTAVRYHQGTSKMSVTGPAGGLQFTVRGRLDGSAKTVQVKPSDVNTPVRCVAITVTGQHRITNGACA